MRKLFVVVVVVLVSIYLDNHPIYPQHWFNF